MEALLEYVHIVQQCIDPHSRWGSYLLRWNLEQTDSVLVADTALARNEKLVAEMLDALINILSTLRTVRRDVCVFCGADARLVAVAGAHIAAGVQAAFRAAALHRRAFTKRDRTNLCFLLHF